MSFLWDLSPEDYHGRGDGCSDFQPSAAPSTDEDHGVSLKTVPQPWLSQAVRSPPESVLP
jgi:hypothetical protein